MILAGTFGGFVMLPLYAIALALGAFLIAVAVFNWDLYFYDPESRLLELIGGETMVRWYWALSGLGVIGWVIWHWAKHG